MFQVECPGCMTAYKVSAEMVGKRLPCKKCGRTIRVMRPTQHAQQKKAANQLPIILIGVGVIGIAIVAFILSRGDDDRKTGPNASGSVASSTQGSTSLETKTNAGADSGTELGPDASVRAFLKAVENFDQPRVMESISHHRFSAQFEPARAILGDQLYGTLDGPARTDYERQLFDLLLSDELRGATRLSAPKVKGPVDLPGNDVEMTVSTEGPKKSAELRFVLVKSAGFGWKVAELHRSGSFFEEPEASIASTSGEEGGAEGGIDEGSGERGGVDQKSGRPSRNDHIAQVPPLADTPPELTEKIEANVAIVMDLSKTSEAVDARNELLRIGKPAIPHLLSAIARKGVDTPDAMMVVNQLVITLRDLTGKRFGFAPQMGLATSGESEEDTKTRALKKWFGWWRTYGDKFVPPEQPEEIRIPKHRKRNADKKVGG